jgi:hypothetical protein
LANEEEGEAKKKDDKKGEKDKDKKEREEIPAKAEKDPKATEVKGVEEDPFSAAPYSDEELKVLQSLSDRREQLDKRARDLDQREKLLQAAEKKVDEKVLEMNNLRKEIDQLLNTQTRCRMNASSSSSRFMKA